jgi:hypothetical protein
MRLPCRPAHIAPCSIFVPTSNLTVAGPAACWPYLCYWGKISENIEVSP